MLYCLGLDNFLLENLNKMDTNTIDLINCFINQLKKPVCLVAHNGNKFDFPILARHLKKLVSGISPGAIPTDILFKFNGNNVNECVFYVIFGSKDRSVDGDLLCVDSLEIFKNCAANETSRSAIDEFLTTDLVAIQNRNEKTPSKSHAFAVISRDPGERPKSAKCLFASPSTSTGNGNAVVMPTPSSQPTKRISYKLTEIYKRFHGSEPTIAHNAEADTIHLLSCAIAIKNEFVELADSSARKFVDVKII